MKHRRDLRATSPLDGLVGNDFFGSGHPISRERLLKARVHRVHRATLSVLASSSIAIRADRKGRVVNAAIYGEATQEEGRRTRTRREEEEEAEEEVEKEEKVAVASRHRPEREVANLADPRFQVIKSGRLQLQAHASGGGERKRRR